MPAFKQAVVMADASLRAEYDPSNDDDVPDWRAAEIAQEVSAEHRRATLSQEIRNETAITSRPSPYPQSQGRLSTCPPHAIHLRTKLSGGIRAQRSRQRMRTFQAHAILENSELQVNKLTDSILGEAQIIAEMEEILEDWGLLAPAGRRSADQKGVWTNDDLAAATGMSVASYKRRKQIAAHLDKNCQDRLIGEFLIGSAHPVAHSTTELLTLAGNSVANQTDIVRFILLGHRFSTTRWCPPGGLGWGGIPFNPEVDGHRLCAASWCSRVFGVRALFGAARTGGRQDKAYCSQEEHPRCGRRDYSLRKLVRALEGDEAAGRAVVKKYKPRYRARAAKRFGYMGAEDFLIAEGSRIQDGLNWRTEEAAHKETKGGFRAAWVAELDTAIHGVQSIGDYNNVYPTYSLKLGADKLGLESDYAKYLIKRRRLLGYGKRNLATRRIRWGVSKKQVNGIVNGTIRAPWIDCEE
jgi:hypothetical protein